jgi:hypothetical protein
MLDKSKTASGNGKRTIPRSQLTMHGDRGDYQLLVL